MSKESILNLIKSEASVNFTQYMKKVLEQNYHSTYYSNLLGFTIYDDKIQFKNYHELHEVPSDELLSQFLPEIKSFKMVAEFWDKNVKSSLALGLKLEKDKEIKYFHVKFGENSPRVLMPKPRGLISILEDKNIPCGISYEYCGDTILKKHYLYIFNVSDMEKVLKINRLTVDATLLEHIECYYTGDDFKINLIYKDSKAEKPDFETISEETKKNYADVVEFLNEHKQPILYVGITKSRKLSVYFSVTEDKNFIENL